MLTVWKTKQIKQGALINCFLMRKFSDKDDHLIAQKMISKVTVFYFFYSWNNLYWNVKWTLKVNIKNELVQYLSSKKWSLSTKFKSLDSRYSLDSLVDNITHVTYQVKCLTIMGKWNSYLLIQSVTGNSRRFWWSHSFESFFEDRLLHFSFVYSRRRRGECGNILDCILWSNKMGMFLQTIDPQPREDA